MSKLQQGAQQAIKNCLEVTPADRVVIVTDEKTLEIGLALEEEAQNIGAPTALFVIENYTSRPATQVPSQLKQEIARFNPTVSIYAAQGQTGELPVFRRPLVDYMFKDLKCRHAHMINISKQLMEDGMNKDYELVYKVTNKVCDLMSKADKLIATDPHGTNITFDLDKENIRWVSSHGKIRAGLPWQNLPSGEAFTCPKSANGVFVAYVLGDSICEKYGELKNPLKVTLVDGLVTKVEPTANDPKTFEAQKDFEAYIKQYELSNKIGELGIGTLVGLDHFVGNLLQDEKYPGLHIAFGHPYPKETGASWDCPSHIDIIAKNVTLKTITGNKEEIIMENGVYKPSILQ